MDNRKKNIVVWFIVWSGLLLVVLYSPIGSPELYTPKNYFMANQGVQFSSTSIVNYSPSKSGYKRAYQDLSAPVYDLPDLKDKTTYSVAGSEKTSRSATSYFNGAANPTDATHQNVSPSGGIDWNLKSLSGKSTKDNSTPQKTGFLALTTDISSLTTTGTRQGTGYALDSGGADPGGSPTGDPVPVGDGWELMILFMGGYLLFKWVIG